MIVLAVDTADAVASVGLWRHGAPGPVRASDEPRAHATHVLALVEAVLAEADETLASVDRFAFGRGPGGLTGLRVAASVVQGFAYARERPVVAVSNLRATALRSATPASRFDGVLVAHEAGMGQVVYGFFGPDAEPLGEEGLAAPGEISWRPGHWRVAGSGRDALSPPDPDVRLDAVQVDGPFAGDIAALGARDDAQQAPPEAAQPRYLRHPVNG